MILLVATSLVVPIAAASTATASTSSAPSGMVGVPADQITATHGDASAWDVYSSAHADTLEIEIGTTSSGDPLLRASDDVNHDGRTLAIDATTLVDAIGYRPEKAVGEHSSGDRWTDEIAYSDGYALIEVEKFSTNDIRFTGTVTAHVSRAADGSQLTYQIDNSSGVDTISAELIGHQSTASETITGTTSAGSSESVSLIGETTQSAEISAKVDDGSVSYGETFGIGGSSDYRPQTVTKTYQTGLLSVNELEITFGSSGYDGYANIYINGQKVGSPKFLDGSTVTRTVSFSEIETPSKEMNVTYEYDPDRNNYMSGVDITNVIYRSPNPTQVDVSSSSDSVTLTDESPSSIALADQSDTLSFSADNGPVEWTLDYTATGTTKDAAVSLNGQQSQTISSLGDGERTSVDLDPSALQDGKNTLTLHTGSANGIATDVGLEYSHVATANQTVDYRGETWSETYNISRKWDSATQDASVTIPFASDRVVGIRDVEYRVNGGSWQPLESYQLDGTTLTAELGSLAEGDTVGVRATGSKVDVSGGSIEVLEPTTEGDTLNSKVKITDHSDSFAIDVGGTVAGNWIHDTYNESWTAPETSVTVGADGAQTIHIPGASAGSTTRVRTLPLEAAPNTGSATLEILETTSEDQEMRFSVDPSRAASSVTYKYHDTVSGEKYYLYSDTHDVVRDSDTAQSPVSLTDDGYSETLAILLDSGSDSSSSSGGGGGVGGGGPVSTATSTAGGVSPTIILVVATAAVGGLALLARRTGLPVWIAGVGAVLVGVFGLETISPGTISDGLSSAIVMLSSRVGRVMPAVTLIVVGLGAYMVVRWWQGRTGPDTRVTFKLGDNK
ncbi:FxsA family protein [Halopiger thermotolerans]